jgi:hypothetical protein
MFNVVLGYMRDDALGDKGRGAYLSGSYLRRLMGGRGSPIVHRGGRLEVAVADRGSDLDLYRDY